MIACYSIRLNEFLINHIATIRVDYMKTTRSAATAVLAATLVISVGLIFAIIESVYAQTYNNTNSSGGGNATKAGNQTNNTAGGMASKIPIIGPALNKIPGLGGK
jgi:hypothetical protein